MGCILKLWQKRLISRESTEDTIQGSPYPITFADSLTSCPVVEDRKEVHRVDRVILLEPQYQIWSDFAEFEENSATKHAVITATALIICWNIPVDVPPTIFGHFKRLFQGLDWFLIFLTVSDKSENLWGGYRTPVRDFSVSDKSLTAT